MKYFKKLVGKEIYLSPMNPDDYEIYCEWINDLTTCIPSGIATNNYTLYQEKDALKKISEGQAFAIVKLNNDEVIGNCSLLDVNNIHGTAELGIFIGSDQNRNKGYGTEASKLLLNYGFKLLNLNNIMIRVFGFNQRALKSYLNIGFKEFGRRREAFLINQSYYDEVYMQLLRKDFRSDVLDKQINDVINLS